ncbi:MAG: hypothetical protein AAGF04_02935 [Chlamydiota bacterium]
MNTYGICAINKTTFNVRCGAKAGIHEYYRYVVLTSLRIHNLIFNILGYMPATRVFSGGTRIFTGVALLLTTLKIGDPGACKGLIIQDWYWEALKTATAQAIRGIFEVTIWGLACNLALDVAATLFNAFVILSTEGGFSRPSNVTIKESRDDNGIRTNYYLTSSEDGSEKSILVPLENPEYCLLFSFLYLV